MTTKRLLGKLTRVKCCKTTTVSFLVKILCAFQQFFQNIYSVVISIVVSVSNSIVTAINTMESCFWEVRGIFLNIKKHCFFKRTENGIFVNIWILLCNVFHSVCRFKWSPLSSNIIARVTPGSISRPIYFLIH